MLGRKLSYHGKVEQNSINFAFVASSRQTLQGLLPGVQVIIERSAAVVGNLSNNQDFFGAIREAGTMQQLVALLEAGSHSRVTEIAAKTLANLAVDESNQTAIRLSGGIPPLMRLLTLKPTDQVRCPDPSYIQYSWKLSDVLGEYLQERRLGASCPVSYALLFMPDVSAIAAQLAGFVK